MSDTHSQELTKAQEVLRSPRGQGGRARRGWPPGCHHVEGLARGRAAVGGGAARLAPHLATLALTLLPLCRQRQPPTSLWSTDRPCVAMCAVTRMDPSVTSCPRGRWWILGGQASTKTWSRRPSPRPGGKGRGSACGHGAMGAPSRHPRCAREESQDTAGWGQRCAACLTRKGIPQRLAPPVLAAWQVGHGAGHGFSARLVSGGRPARCSGATPTQATGLPTQRYKVWTVLHNFDCRAPDGTTPAARFFRRTFPELFETVLSRIDALPQPRRRKHQGALCH